MIGRWGCHFAGLADGTYGVPTTLPWGVDYGDHIARHPVALYESGAMAAFFAAGSRGARWYRLAFAIYYGLVLPGARSVVALGWLGPAPSFALLLVLTTWVFGRIAARSDRLPGAGRGRRRLGRRSWR